MAYAAQSSQRHALDYSHKQLFYLSVFSVVIILIGGVVALLLQHVGTRFIASADGGSVVGSPSLPASAINAIFKRVGSPMAGTGNVVEQASRNMQIDDAFALAVWWTETNDGEAGTGRPDGDHNPAGVRNGAGYPRDYGDYAIFPSYTAAIEYWFGMMRHQYVDRGLNTVYAISYPYVGTSSSPLWAAKVMRLMFEYRGEAPPPAAIPTIMPITTVTPEPIESPVVPRGSEQHTRPREINARPFSGHHQAQSPAIQTSSVPRQADAVNGVAWIEPALLLFALLAACAAAMWGMRTIRAKRSKHLAFAWDATIPFSMQHLVPEAASSIPSTTALHTSSAYLVPEAASSIQSTTALRTTSVYLAPARGATTFPSTSTLRTTSSLLPSYDQLGSYTSQPLYYNETFGSSDSVNLVPTTEGLEVDIARVIPLNLPTVSRETDPRIRRVKLVPSPTIHHDDMNSPVTKEPMAVGARPTGLLTRYREMQQMS